MVRLFYDVETTGLDPNKNYIHQLAGIVEVDGEIAESFDIKSGIVPGLSVTKEALAVCHITEKDLAGYQSPKSAHFQFTGILKKYVDRFDRHDKAWLVGYNNRYFDDYFLRNWFLLNGDNYFGSYFWSDSQDTMTLASAYLEGERRIGMRDFRLETVAREIGIVVDDGRLHDASYDAELTRAVYRIVRGIELEI